MDGEGVTGARELRGRDFTAGLVCANASWLVPAGPMPDPIAKNASAKPKAARPNRAMQPLQSPAECDWYIRPRNRRELRGSLFNLVPQDWRRIRILAQRTRIPVRQNLHHPVVKIIHRVAEDRLETSVVFLVRTFNIISQTVTQILVFFARFYVVRAEHPNVLHRNLGHAVRTPV
jgi:hypothetical protein